eukprot:TRINITY_DN4626_c0_g1_i6.p1 TRINITY_DN4626_c0_g1~~TRINITY_DN4626_c0_g1_i6.p1  ORF type:complete len:241 (-),score=62.10 TRINITY_DN4626_c0_g1_i6:149-871(-)
MEVLDSLKQPFLARIKETKKLLSQVESSRTTSAKEQLLREAGICIREAEGLIQAIKGASSRTGVDVPRLEEYREEIAILKETLRAQKEKFDEENRFKLLPKKEQRPNVTDHTDDDVVEKHLTQKLSKSTQTLLHANQLAGEAIDFGGTTLSDLQTQGETLQGARAQLGSMNDALSVGKNLMKNIWAKMMTSQGLKIITIIVLILCNLTIAYHLFFWSPERSPHVTVFNGTHKQELNGTTG